MDRSDADQIRAFIGGRFPEVEFTDSDDIFSFGFINSLFAMELVMFIERAFAITLATEELQLANFRTVRGMAEVVARHTEPAVLGSRAE
ncbi:acyl carrier protein [Cryptosporangium sp. NPDC051539]|uniref:acyl carrier protein n=1 Tax=Cryptosporangium sp. NPDC051539 TaxID=3363962 RepID=UPI0037987B46